MEPDATLQMFWLDSTSNRDVQQVQVDETCTCVKCVILASIPAQISSNCKHASQLVVATICGPGFRLLGLGFTSRGQVSEGTCCTLSSPDTYRTEAGSSSRSPVMSSAPFTSVPGTTTSELLTSASMLATCSTTVGSCFFALCDSCFIVHCQCCCMFLVWQSARNSNFAGTEHVLCYQIN